MGEIRDAITTLMDVKADFVDTRIIHGSKRSISASAMQGTANFPMLLENTISLEDGGVDIARAAEKNFASFLLTVMTMDPFLEVERGETPTADKYLRQFHQNLRTKNPEKGFHMSVTDFIKEATEIHPDYNIMESEAFNIAYAVYEGVLESVPQDRNIMLNYTIEDVTTEGTLNAKFNSSVLESREKMHRRKQRGGNDDEWGDYEDYVEDNKSYQANSPDYSNYNTSDTSPNYTIDRVTFHKSSRQGASNTYNTFNIDMPSNRPIVKNNINQGDTVVKPTIKTGDTNFNPTIKTGNVIVKQPKGAQMRTNVRDRGGQWKTLTDNDCKKANDMVPTLLHIRVYPVDEYTREEYTPIDFMMGVKCTIHPIPTDEIAKMVISAMNNNDMVFNFIRWKTGEIRFFKDFLFAVDAAKMDARDSKKDASGWGAALRRRKRLSKTKIRLTDKSILPNATLVVSTDGIQYIKDNYGYDLGDPRIQAKLIDAYFLLGYVVADMVSRRVTFKFDGFDATQTYTFDSLKKENQNDDKAFKNMMKMLGRSM